MKEQHERVEILTDIQIQKLYEIVEQGINDDILEFLAEDSHETLDRTYERFFETKLGDLVENIKVELIKKRIDEETFDEDEGENNRIKIGLKGKALTIAKEISDRYEEYEEIIYAKALHQTNKVDIEKVFKQLFNGKKLVAGNQKARAFLLSIPRAIQEFNDTFQIAKEEYIDNCLIKIGDEKEIDEDLARKARIDLNETADQAWLDFNYYSSLIPQEAFPDTEEEGDELNTEPLKTYLARRIFPSNSRSFKYYDAYNQVLLNSKKLATKEEKEDNILEAWGKFVATYNELDAEDNQTQIAFMIALMEFIRKRAAFTHSIGDEIPILDKAIHDFLVDTDNALEFDPAKAAIIDQIIPSVTYVVANPSVGLGAKAVQLLALEIARGQILPESTNLELLADKLEDPVVVDNLSPLYGALSKLGHFIYRDPAHRTYFSKQKETETRKMDILKGYLEQEPNSAAMLATIIGQQSLIAAQSNTRHTKEVSRFPLDHLHALQRQANIPKMLQQQAADKHKVSHEKYTISDQEAQLLSSITRIPVSKLVFNKKPHEQYPQDTLSYQEFIQKIDTEIDRRNRALDLINSKWYSSFIPFKKRINGLSTYPLEQAKAIVNYYQEQHLSNKSPETRLNPINEQGQRRSAKAPEAKASNIRMNLLKAASRLSSLFKVNAQLKQLNQIINNKTVLAKEIKKKGAPLLQNDSIQRADREEELARRLREKKPIVSTDDLEARGQEFFTETPGFKKREDLLDRLNLVNEEIDKLNNEITTAKSQVQPSIESEEDPREKIANLYMAKKFAEEARKSIMIKINHLDLSKYIDLFKANMQKDLKNFLETFTVDSNPASADVLNKIGKKLSESKEAKKHFKSQNLIYSQLLNLHIIAKKEVAEFLATLVQSPDKTAEEIKGAIEDWAAELTLKADLVLSGIDVVFDKNHMIAAKFLTMAKDLKFIANKIDINGENQFETIQAGYQAQIESLESKNKLEMGCVNELLRASSDSIDAFKYMADHRTDSLGRPQRA